MKCQFCFTRRFVYLCYKAFFFSWPILILCIATKFSDRYGRGTGYATCERFLHGGKENDPAYRVGNDVPGSRVTTTVPVACGYVESFIEKVSPHLQ